MTDTDKLREIIRLSGLKKAFIADKLGLSYQGYLNKEMGLTEFTAPEISILKDLLNLTSKQVIEIFLSKSRQKGN